MWLAVCAGCLGSCCGNPQLLTLAAAQDMERRKAHDARELRDLSRQMYLTKREQQKLDELRDKIEDEERLFAVRPPRRSLSCWGDFRFM